jgi:hypothetical protein
MTERTTPNALVRFMTSCHDMTARDRHNARRISQWLAAWAVAYLGVLLLDRFELLRAGLPLHLLVVVAIVLGVAPILAYARFILQADELHRKMHLEALALGCGGGFLGNFGFELLERTGLAEFNVQDPIGMMVLFYLAGLALAARRYA